MAMFEEQKVVSNGNFKQISLGDDLSKGQSLYFYIGGFETRNSAEYGDFIVAEGAELKSDASTADAMVNEATGASFVPNTMLRNLIDSGSLASGKVYRIERKWNKGDEFNGKKAKGHGYECFECKVPAEQIVKLRDIYIAAKTSGVEGGDSVNPSKTASKPKL